MFFLASFISLICMAQENNNQKPTLEQILTSKVFSITIKCFPEGADYNEKLWHEIIVNGNDLIEKCYASDVGQFTNEQIFAEIHETIDFVHERTDGTQGIRGIVEIHLGQPEKQ